MRVALVAIQPNLTGMAKSNRSGWGGGTAGGGGRTKPLPSDESLEPWLLLENASDTTHVKESLAAKTAAKITFISRISAPTLVAFIRL